jgi:hypothetical protein
MAESSLDIHRLLDEAFAGIEITPDVQDLKEEMRANLVVRVSELEGTGLSAADAARRAIAEVGDVRAILADMPATTGPLSTWQRHRVRPNPAFVIRTVLLAVLGVAALAFLVLTSTVWIAALGLELAAVGVVAVVGAVIVGDSLRQETSTNYPVPARRAAGYATATAVGLLGLGAAVPFVSGHDVMWPIAGGVLVLASVVSFVYLGTTQTNRHKPWVMRMQADLPQMVDRFSMDPMAAARFGMYTGMVWVLALGAFVVLGFTVNWAWSWLALLGALVVTMLMLARMLFTSPS